MHTRELCDLLPNIDLKRHLTVMAWKYFIGCVGILVLFCLTLCEYIYEYETNMKKIKKKLNPMSRLPFGTFGLWIFI